MADECIFCKIASGKSPANIEYQDKDMVAFWDVNPKAKIHILIVPKKHISSVVTLERTDEKLVGEMVLAARQLARDKGLEDDGYRLVINAGKHAGQVVEHLHLHLMGGGPLGSMG